MTELRKGITTGSCAAAAAKAATQLLANRNTLQEVEVTLPSQEKLLVKIANVHFIEENKTIATVIKDAGDDPDVTHGAEIQATAEWSDEYQLSGGIGVGTVTKPGLAISPGEPAINPVPRQMIATAVGEILPEKNVKIVVCVPRGAELAKRTLNPKLGIIGGISILGTTGIVEPMSEEAYKNSLVPQLDIANFLGYKDIILVPGKIGEKSVAGHLLVNVEAVVQTSNFIGFMLEKAVERGQNKILLWGHIAKLVKLAAGNMHTHNRISDARMETLTAHAALLGRGDLAEKIMDCNTAEEAVQVLTVNNAREVLFISAEAARKRVQGYLFDDAEVAVVFTDLKGSPISWSNNLESFLEDVGWQKKFMW